MISISRFHFNLASLKNYENTQYILWFRYHGTLVERDNVVKRRQCNLTQGKDGSYYCLHYCAALLECDDEVAGSRVQRRRHLLYILSRGRIKSLDEIVERTYHYWRGIYGGVFEYIDHTMLDRVNNREEIL